MAASKSMSRSTDPTGRPLLIPLPNGADEREEDGPMTPEEIARVLAAMERIEPFVWTEEERPAWAADRLARKEWEKATSTNTPTS